MPKGTQSRRVHCYAEGNAVEACTDAAVKLGCASVNGNAVPLGGVAQGLCAVFHHDLEHLAAIIGCSANEEVCRLGAPGALEPFDICLVAAGGKDNGLGLDAFFLAVVVHERPLEGVVLNAQIHGFGFVGNFHAQLFGSCVIGVDEGFASAQEEAVGTGKVKRAAHGRLEMNTLFHHPVADIVGAADNQARHGFDGIALGDAQKVLVALFLFIGTGQKGVLRGVDIADITRMPAVAAPHILGRGLDELDCGSGPAGSDSCAQGCVAAANDENVQHFLVAG